MKNINIKINREGTSTADLLADMIASGVKVTIHLGDSK